MDSYSTIYDLAFFVSLISGYIVYRCDKCIQSALVTASLMVILGCTEYAFYTVCIAVFFAINGCLYSRNLSEKYNCSKVKLVFSLAYSVLFIALLVGVIKIDWSHDPQFAFAWIKTESIIILAYIKEAYQLLFDKISSIKVIFL